ncbi:peroxiredoxin-2b [Quercus suber]|uniref:glutaredoxin-dependent peroxiredoxin n=2 Tax=Quercus suber TaxID=58331 RepID=A0AAW0IQF0_QUESU
MAPIAVGNVIPDGSLSYFDDKDDLQSVSVHSLAAGKKVILFGVPGAFTPTCRGHNKKFLQVKSCLVENLEMNDPDM